MSRLYYILFTLVFAVLFYSNIDFFFPIRFKNAKSIPQVDIISFFSGSLDGWGVVTHWNERVKNRFLVEIDDTGDGGFLLRTLFNDGVEKIKSIKLQRNGNSIIINSGSIMGDISYLKYGASAVLKFNEAIKSGSKIYEVRVEHTIHFTSNETAIITTKFKKYGFTFNKAITSLKKREE